MQILYSIKFFALTAFGFCSSSLFMEIVISVVLISWVKIAPGYFSRQYKLVDEGRE